MMRIENTEQLAAFARDFVQGLTPGVHARVVTLSGELGAGKTAFVQEVARALGVNETVSSPTFVIEKVYALKGSPPIRGFSHLVHIDAYRLKGSDELASLGWSGTVSNPGNLILIEWPERVPDLIPEGAIQMRFDIEGDARIISINDRKENSPRP